MVQVKQEYKKISTNIGALPINAVVMQDDISKMNDNLKQARDGCKKIHNTLMRKQLSVNLTKREYKY